MPMTEGHLAETRDRRSAAIFMNFTLTAALAQARKEHFDGLIERLEAMRREISAIQHEAQVALARDRMERDGPMASPDDIHLVRAGAEWGA